MSIISKAYAADLIPMGAVKALSKAELNLRLTLDYRNGVRRLR